MVQSSPNTPKRTTTSTQLKLRLIAAAPSCVAVAFIPIATGTISEKSTRENLFAGCSGRKFLEMS
jgi:hypothetical protein